MAFWKPAALTMLALPRGLNVRTPLHSHTIQFGSSFSFAREHPISNRHSADLPSRRDPLNQDIVAKRLQEGL